MTRRLLVLRRYLAFAGWLLCHLVAGAFWTVSGAVIGACVFLSLLGMADLEPEVWLMAGTIAAAAIYIGYILLPPAGTRPSLRPPRGYSAADDGPPAPLDPDDPLERMWNQREYLPPPEHRVRPSVPPPPVRKDGHQ